MNKLLNPKTIYRYFKAAKGYYRAGKRILNNPSYIDAQNKSRLEMNKTPLRTEIINFTLSLFARETCYLEIGVRNPDDNFNHINANKKYSVDPGIEFEENPVDFKLTSDDFFEKLSNNEILPAGIKFDVIFIDGLHLAEQVDRDIKNSLDNIRDDGFVVLHDCNPPTEWHARNEYRYFDTPAGGAWNGTTWKAFLKWRFSPYIQSCCVDSDWGVGILSKSQQIGQSIDKKNIFYEFDELMANRVELLNLLTFKDFQTLVANNTIRNKV